MLRDPATRTSTWRGRRCTLPPGRHRTHERTRGSPDDVSDSDVAEMLNRIRERAALIPPLEWLTASARDAVKIAVCFAGFDCRELVGRLSRVRSRGERLNVATVYRVTGEMDQAWGPRRRESAR